MGGRAGAAFNQTHRDGTAGRDLWAANLNSNSTFPKWPHAAGEAGGAGGEMLLVLPSPPAALSAESNQERVCHWTNKFLVSGLEICSWADGPEESSGLALYSTDCLLERNYNIREKKNTTPSNKH